MPWFKKAELGRQTNLPRPNAPFSKRRAPFPIAVRWDSPREKTAGIFLKNWAGIPAPQGMDPNCLGWVSFLWKNLLPVTIGNIIGGGVFVGMSYLSAYLKPSKS
ncbi:MAG TPA: formate/nitrite transporter family protein [Candidatus Methylomirabilis sp.]